MKVPRFLCLYVKKGTIKYNRLGDLGKDKKTTYEKQRLRQATEPIDNNGGNMYALA